MPSEMRYLVFATKEVVAAVRDYRRRRGQPMVPGQVVRCAVVADPDVSATVDVRSDADAKLYSVVLKSEELAAALIMYCINQRIPMPAAATKSLQMFGDSLGLVITKSLGDQAAGPAPQRRRCPRRRARGRLPPPATLSGARR